MKQKVLVSIDVEAPIGANGVNFLIYGRIGNDYYGIDYLMDIFDENGIKGLFFVDVCEAWEYERDVFLKMMRHIDSRGHDVGVHVHPDRMADKNRRFLWQYNYEEQYDIIKKATDLYIEALDKKPISFRAGRYGANDDTIDILNKLGYKIDMSYFYGKKNCRITSFNGHNKVQVINGILEVPVTSFVSFSFLKYMKYEKTDSGLHFKEHKFYLKKLYGNIDVISFFAHSFSLLKWRAKPNDPSFSKKLDKRFQKNLSLYLDSNAFVFITEKDLLSFDETHDSDKRIVFKGIRPFFFFVRTCFQNIINRLINNV